MTITKADLADYISSQTGMVRSLANDCVQTVLEGIVESLHRDQKVEIRGFGSFRVRTRGPRLGRNPMTGEAVNVPAVRVPFFTPGKILRDGLVVLKD